MKRLSFVILFVFTISIFNVPTFAIGTSSLLQQKMLAKGKTAGTAKIIAQYQTKFKQLLGQIQYQYNVLDSVVKQSQNLSDDDKSTLIDILENDPDYSWTNVQSTYNTMMSTLSKSDVQELSKTLQEQYRSFSDVLKNLSAYSLDLPQYYIYGDNTKASEGNNQTNDMGDNSKEILNNNEKNTTSTNAIELSNAINIKTNKPLTLEQMEYILNKIKPGDNITINGQSINYDKVKSEVQKMLNQKQEKPPTDRVVQPTTTNGAINVTKDSAIETK